MSYMIEVNGLKKQYGDFTAVDGATFSINPGEVVGFLGPNGAGKTTTIKMITGLLAPNEGEALITGLDIQKEPLKVKAQFAYVPDTPNLYGKLKAIEYLHFMAQLYRVPSEDADERIKRMLELFELTDNYQLAFITSGVLFCLGGWAVWMAAPRRIRLVPGKIRD